MTKDELFELYVKEREYEEKIFGTYAFNPALNLASFIVFLDNYLKRLKEGYCGLWSPDPPEWLQESYEGNKQGSVPVKAYEELIKLFTLAGAALESYSVVDVKKWREEGVKEKWHG